MLNLDIKFKTLSMHWSNTIAVKDRCDFSELEDDMPTVPDLSEINIESFVPDKDDYERLIKNISIEF